MLRLRSTRVICAGPAPSETSATFMSGTGPFLPGTDKSWRRSRSLRDVSFRRTRIGIWRLSRLNFDRLVLTSPLVAMRVTRLSVSVVTPSSAAFSGSGRITISGFCSAALLVIMPSPGIARISRSALAAARFRRFGSSPASVTESRLPPPPPPNWNRAPGMARRISVALRSKSCCAPRVPSGLSSWMTIEPRRTLPAEPPPVGPSAAALRADGRVDAAHFRQRVQAPARGFGDLERVLRATRPARARRSAS